MKIGFRNFLYYTSFISQGPLCLSLALFSQFLSGYVKLLPIPTTSLELSFLTLPMEAKPRGNVSVLIFFDTVLRLTVELKWVEERMGSEGVGKIKVFSVFSSERAQKVFFYQHLEN